MKGIVYLLLLITLCFAPGSALANVQRVSTDAEMPVAGFCILKGYVKAPVSNYGLTDVCGNSEVVNIENSVLEPAGYISENIDSQPSRARFFRE